MDSLSTAASDFFMSQEISLRVLEQIGAPSHDPDYDHFVIERPFSLQQAISSRPTRKELYSLISENYSAITRDELPEDIGSQIISGDNAYIKSIERSNPCKRYRGNLFIQNIDDRMSLMLMATIHDLGHLISKRKPEDLLMEETAEAFELFAGKFLQSRYSQFGEECFSIVYISRRSAINRIFSNPLKITLVESAVLYNAMKDDRTNPENLKQNYEKAMKRYAYLLQS